MDIHYNVVRGYNNKRIQDSGRVYGKWHVKNNVVKHVIHLCEKSLILIWVNIVSCGIVYGGAFTGIHGSRVSTDGLTTTYTMGDEGYYSRQDTIVSFTKFDGSKVGGVFGSTVTVDNRSGLMWLYDPVAAGVGGATTWSNAITRCENLSYAGFNDWRLPSILELVSLVYMYSSTTAIDSAYFVNMMPTAFPRWWSSTTTGTDTNAFSLNGEDGRCASQVKTLTTPYVTCVRFYK